MGPSLRRHTTCASRLTLSQLIHISLVPSRLSRLLLSLSLSLSLLLLPTLALVYFLSLSPSLSSFPAFLTMSDQQLTHFALDKLPVKLEGASNYTTWCTYVKAALKGQNLFGHITGKTVQPAATADAKSQEEWDRRDEKAQSIIMLGVTPAIVNHIAGDMTAKDVGQARHTVPPQGHGDTGVAHAAALHCSASGRGERGQAHLRHE